MNVVIAHFGSINSPDVNFRNAKANQIIDVTAQKLQMFVQKFHIKGELDNHQIGRKNEQEHDNDSVHCPQT
jgi:hypothetical protein